MNRPLSGRCALITGSSQGIGLAIARRLAADGCDVVLHGLDGLQTLRADLERESGARVRTSGADLRDPRQIAAMIADAIEDFERLDILVNNAVARHAAPVEAFTPEDWDESIAVNLSAAFHTIRLSLPGMKQRGWGRIVNVSSIYGLRGAVNRVGYVTTKTALIGLTRAVALETARDGITCNAVSPGTSESPTHQDVIARLAASEGIPARDAEARVLVGKQPSGRLIAADGVAALVGFLCTDGAADITGATLPVDAGWSAS